LGLGQVQMSLVDAGTYNSPLLPFKLALVQLLPP
jgi:hypothetical protein